MLASLADVSHEMLVVRMSLANVLAKEVPGVPKETRDTMLKVNEINLQLLKRLAEIGRKIAYV